MSVSAREIERFLMQNTIWCPRLRLRCRPDFCLRLKRRPLEHRPFQCEKCAGPGKHSKPSPGRPELVEPEHPKLDRFTLRKRRKALGLTQGQLAEMLSVSDALISAWECGRQHIPKRYHQELRHILVDRIR